MDNFFQNKQGRVVAVEPSTTVRSLITETLRHFGFEDVEGLASVKDVIKALEVEKISWIITPLTSDADVNAFQLLKICSQHSRLKNTRISFLVDESELDLLPMAFEMGLFHYLMKPFNKDEFKKRIDSLLKNLKTNEGAEVLVTADLLRTLLSTRGDHKTRLAFEKKLVHLFPGKPDLLLNIVEPLAAMGQKQQALSTIAQVKLLNPKLAAKADELTTKYELNKTAQGPDTDGNEVIDEKFNILGMNTVWIIDHDQNTTDILNKCFGELGIPEVKVFKDGNEVVEALAGSKPDLIAMEWAVPALGAPLLLQRFNEKGLHHVPVVIVSSLLEKDDIPLTREMGVAEYIKKPVQAKEFTDRIIWLIQEERSPQELGTLERKFRKTVDSGNISEAKNLAKKLIDTAGPDNNEVLSRINSEIAYLEDDYKRAKYFAIEALKFSGESLFILNLLGKSMMKLGELDNALKCFEKAQLISPMNLIRLCSMAEVNAQLGNDEEANSLVESARELDEGAKSVQETSANVALVTGDNTTALKYIGQLESFKNIVAFLNNKAISLARSGNFNGSIELYENALSIFPKDQLDQAIIYFNMGMAYLRADKYEDAKAVLEKACLAKSDKLASKAKNLTEKVATAIKKNTKLNFAASATSNGSTTEHLEAGPSNEQATEQNTEGKPEIADIYVTANFEEIEQNTGNRWCHGLYSDAQNKNNSQCNKLLSSLPHFTFRAAIKKDDYGKAS
ncbi:MAG: response regulator [Oligoflexales bacterium]|nr:response regulator [Oligoflexales bacterium]